MRGCEETGDCRLPDARLEHDQRRGRNGQRCAVRHQRGKTWVLPWRKAPAVCALCVYRRDVMELVQDCRANPSLRARTETSRPQFADVDGWYAEESLVL